MGEWFDTALAISYLGMAVYATRVFPRAFKLFTIPVFLAGFFILYKVWHHPLIVFFDVKNPNSCFLAEEYRQKCWLEGR